MSDGSRAFEPILRTKLHRSRLDADLVNRERLIELMNRAGEVPLTLVSAPAGYGKSVLVAQWVERARSPFAWLSLDARDSELRTFLRYFLAAVETVAPGACNETRELLAAGSLAPIPILASYLLNDLDAMDGPCTLVLDDYHRIEPLSQVHDLMLRILEHPPAQFHLVVVTRQDPPFDLPSLRAAHRINEVRLQDLRFTARETSEFLGATVDVSVSEEALSQVEREVEGWAAGLRLVSLTLRNVGDAEAFLRKLPGRLPEIQEYLLREVLAAQTAQVRDRLLASSILDRFCAEVLDAVCEPLDDGEKSQLTAADFLKELRQGHLFAVSLDAGGEWYRYHHLFQELLVNELQRIRGPEHVAALHLRASRWFEDQGRIDEAIKHALAAEDTGRAVRLVARHRHAALNADRWYVLEDWLSLLPPGAVQQQAELLMARAWIALNFYYRVEAVPPLLDEAESLLGETPADEQVRGEIAMSRGYVHWLLGAGAEGLKQLEVALERIPSAHVDLRSNAESAFAQANQMVGRKELGIRYLDDQLAHSDSPHGMRETRLLAGRVFINLTAGDLQAAEVANRRMWAVVEGGGSSYVRAWTRYLQGVIHLQRCEWEVAAEFLGQAVAQRFTLHARAEVDSMTGLALAHLALGQDDEARAALQIFEEYVTQLGDPAMERLLESAEARLAILQGRLGTVRRWLDGGEPPPEGALLWWLEIPSITRCRAMLAVGFPDGPAQAEEQLSKCADVVESQHNDSQLIRVLTLLALAEEEQGKTELALRTLERALTLARRGKLLLPFVESGARMVDLLERLPGEQDFAAQVKRLGAAFGDTPGTRAAEVARAGRREAGRAVAAGRFEDLTNRELDVLELLAQRLQNKEIAARLQISHQTVSSHLKQIYQKLGVHGRREAVDHAVAGGILDR